MENLPSDDEKLAEWLVKRWEDKEEKLRRFHEPEESSKKHFENTPSGKLYEVSLFVKSLFCRRQLCVFGRN